MSTNNTIYVGMDVHKEKIVICGYVPEVKLWDPISIPTNNLDAVVRYLKTLHGNYDLNADLVCGYEAGCLGTSIYRYLSSKGINCKIVAPSTILVPAGNKRVKTDSRDAAAIAKSIATDTCKYVCLPTEQDEAVKEFIRMRDDHKLASKKLKQQIKALCLREGLHYNGRENWSQKYIDWLRNVELPSLIRETLNEYLYSLDWIFEKIKRLEKRIEDISKSDAYKDRVKKLCCFAGIKTITAMALICEVGDFSRFPRAECFASFLGLTPGEFSSGEKTKRLSITKAGNSHLRRLLVEASNSYRRTRIPPKSKELKKRQEDVDPQIIQYADKARERLIRRYKDLTQKSMKKANVAVTAIARELAGFIWGMMVGKTN